MGYGAIYSSTWWGNPQQDGWGSVYYAIASPSWSLNSNEWQNENRTYIEV